MPKQGKGGQKATFFSLQQCPPFFLCKADNGWTSKTLATLLRLGQDHRPHQQAGLRRWSLISPLRNTWAAMSHTATGSSPGCAVVSSKQMMGSRRRSSVGSSFIICQRRQVVRAHSEMALNIYEQQCLDKSAVEHLEDRLRCRQATPAGQELQLRERDPCAQTSAALI